VTIDVIGCQKAIAKKIVAGGVVKALQERLLEDIQNTVTKALDGQEERFGVVVEALEWRCVSWLSIPG
jgi:hypothetical protein